MEDTFGSRLKHAWNAFFNRDPTIEYRDDGAGYSYRPDRPSFTRSNKRSIVNAYYNRIAIDVSAITIQHCQLDSNNRFTSVIDSKLNKCLNLESNIDQSGRAFIQDIVISMLDEGCVAVVPVETTGDPQFSESYDVLSMRTAKIIEWYPTKVKLRLYNDRTGRKEEITLPKRMVGIIENPFYAVINEPNSTMQRLIRKLNLLDAIDEQSGSGKLDLIVRLPYTVKSDTRKKQAEDRRKDIESQLANSKYGIAYIDATENVTQLNRPVENNLMKQVEYLTSMLNSQLGMSQTILDGTADDQTMLNYFNITIEPIVSAIVDEFRRKFLSKTARGRGQSILYFRDPFKFVTMAQLSEASDKLTRNEIASSNEIRQVMGWKPSDDPNADMLRNSNIAHPEGALPSSESGMNNILQEGGINQNGETV